MRLLLASLAVLLLCMGPAHAQTLNCVSPAPDGTRCLVPGTGTAPAGTVLGTVTSPGTMFQFMDPIGRYQLQGNNLVTLVPLPAGQRAGVSLGPCVFAYGPYGGIGDTPPPSAYSAPWDVTETSLVKDWFLAIPCATDQVGVSRVLSVGSKSTYAAWKTIQISTNGVTWTPVQLTPTGTTVGSWYVGGGTTTLPSTSGWIYVQFLVAVKQATGWAYGGCTAPTLAPSGCQPKWGIQAFFVPPVTINSVSVTPGTFSSAAAVNWPITTVMSDSSSFAGTYYIAGANTCGFGVTANAVTLAAMCPPGTYSDWQIVAVPNDPTIPTMSSPGGTATAIGATIVSISASAPCTPTSCTIYDTASIGTLITTFQCTMSDTSACPPSGYGWSLSGAPANVSIDSTSGRLTTSVGPPLSDGTSTFDVNVNPMAVGIASISPTAVTIPDNIGVGQVVQRFQCNLTNGLVGTCTWGLSTGPSWLTMSPSGTLSTTAAAPSPLPQGNYSAGVVAQ